MKMNVGIISDRNFSEDFNDKKCIPIGIKILKYFQIQLVYVTAIVLLVPKMYNC
jgi:hypothetical protein